MHSGGVGVSSAGIRLELDSDYNSEQSNAVLNNSVDRTEEFSGGILCNPTLTLATPPDSDSGSDDEYGELNFIKSRLTPS